ncbi:MAG: hypothetical protein EZS28_013486 [Streblomastix strix]|uniref:Uncharacterized protein n=1 Tax=Streblomastix strix TaxID=222440 RepID=A0A5J4W8L6_9EUKA|nr:MAG: hypothetical protein EZS28_013486 [Streblomastix strix]
MIESVELKEKEMKGLLIIVVVVVIIVNTILMNWMNMKTMMEKIAITLGHLTMCSECADVDFFLHSPQLYSSTSVCFPKFQTVAVYPYTIFIKLFFFNLTYYCEYYPVSGDCIIETGVYDMLIEDVWDKLLEDANVKNKAALLFIAVLITDRCYIGLGYEAEGEDNNQLVGDTCLGDASLELLDDVDVDVDDCDYESQGELVSECV